MKIEIIKSTDNNPVAEFFSSSSTPETDAFAIKFKTPCESIVDKANELIARWDQPSWKDTAPTAGFIHALRDAVEDYEKQKP